MCRIHSYPCSPGEENIVYGGKIEAGDRWALRANGLSLFLVD